MIVLFLFSAVLQSGTTTSVAYYYCRKGCGDDGRQLILRHKRFEATHYLSAIYTEVSVPVGCGCIGKTNAIDPTLDQSSVGP